MKIKLISVVLGYLLGVVCSAHPADVFIEAESFTEKGGWVLDQQFMDQMGSPYLMARGLGKVVADASRRPHPQTTAFAQCHCAQSL